MMRKKLMYIWDYLCDHSMLKCISAVYLLWTDCVSGQHFLLEEKVNMNPVLLVKAESISKEDPPLLLHAHNLIYLYFCVIS